MHVAERSLNWWHGTPTHCSRLLLPVADNQRRAAYLLSCLHFHDGL